MRPPTDVTELHGRVRVRLDALRDVAKREAVIEAELARLKADLLAAVARHFDKAE